MANLLHLDASARPGRSGVDSHGSHSRRLSAHFVEQWQQARPGDRILYRDLGQHPPRPVSGDWIHAAFTKPEAREPWMLDALSESDTLVDELLEADVIVAGVPMYNFGVPAGFKAYIDNIVRVGRTFGFDRSRQGLPYWPMLTDMHKQMVVLGSRGDYGYEPGERMAHANHVEPHIRTVFGYLGIDKVHGIAVEYDEFGDERLQKSLAQAERNIKALVAELGRSLT
ncbi:MULTISPECIES: FMN-dependent NADH-azoreductase [unclassified Halomonas]|uniref:FMN-dependent NADH-azoreductase n=1 Tax=unclassified Halomonas TaxID=2609666 RepID=UPI001CF2AE4D|nr:MULTISPECIES: NAD(P)H-dependent oxidoreductase [unclassified Halomonas]MCA8864265.1 NAD(P)H dehydrogenase [Halomonas sp. SBBP1]UZH10118.1 NAD(P)H-dependent oxidoreductase [Halomonas sp. BDJS001]